MGAGRDGAVESASWVYRWRLWSRGWVIDPQLVDAAYLHGVAVLSLVQVLGLELPLLHLGVLQGRQGVLDLSKVKKMSSARKPGRPWWEGAR